MSLCLRNKTNNEFLQTFLLYILNSDSNLRDKFIDILKIPTCTSEAIQTITSTYIERLI